MRAQALRKAMGGVRTELQRAKDKCAATRQELIEVTESKRASLRTDR